MMPGPADPSRLGSRKGNRGPMSDPYRLPRTVVPSRYELTLTPDLRTAAFAGEETVTVTVGEAVREVLLNAADLEIGAVLAWDERGRQVVARAELEPAHERARLVVAEPLPPGVVRGRGPLPPAPHSQVPRRFPGRRRGAAAAGDRL